ncbi:hypothetical protein P6B95_41600 [Streptomyces atratus]|uniref:protein-L-isoaspartate O-methyltransferase family protein n=1 Tax=Streptomyces atratus TaxID=1893 RepID=UPI002AC327E7|nr:hypothetical protein [Streptomyces atratus]WPW33212.1 hypothetical protein P6B95_41600 [Streptomyces atratus]
MRLEKAQWQIVQAALGEHLARITGTGLTVEDLEAPRTKRAGVPRCRRDRQDHPVAHPGGRAEPARATERAGEKNVTALTAEGYLGHPAKGPYDRIVVTCGVTGISPHWLDQLSDDGLIVVPVAHGGFHPTLSVTRDKGRLVGHGVMSSDFMSAAGPLYAWPAGQPPALTEPFQPQPLSTRENVGPALDGDGYYDLWFHLGPGPSAPPARASTASRLPWAWPACTSLAGYVTRPQSARGGTTSWPRAQGLTQGDSGELTGCRTA